jgi:hypothetical protein
MSLEASSVAACASVSVKEGGRAVREDSALWGAPHVTAGAAYVCAHVHMRQAGVCFALRMLCCDDYLNIGEMFWNFERLGCNWDDG